LKMDFSMKLPRGLQPGLLKSPCYETKILSTRTLAQLFKTVNVWH